MKIWHCPAGRFQGFETETCYQLRGIRYASSERFGEPAAYTYPEGVHSCLYKSPYAVQLPSRTEEFLFGVDYDQVKQEESCLYLSLTIPKCAEKEPKLPVMVWIHGGAFRNGGCDHDCYSSDLLAAEGSIIVVRLNYRLGVLGYVKNTKGSAVNLGLMDVIMALRWIQENIASFGGDKENITLFGQSAGAQTIACLLVADGAGGQCWYYDFTWTMNRSALGACHCMELIPLFGGKGLEGRPIMMAQTEREVVEAGKPLRETWTDFAKNGTVTRLKIPGMITISKQ